MGFGEMPNLLMKPIFPDASCAPLSKESGAWDAPYKTAKPADGG